MSMPAERLQQTMTLQQLLRGIGVAPAIPVGGLEDDSRRIESGDVFVAVQGSGHHGLVFAEQAIERGAAAILWDSATGDAALATGSVPFVAIDGLAGQLGELANRFYDSPSHAVDVVGVTGTNGKTTVAFLLAQCLQMLGKPCAYLGTLGAGTDELVVDLGMTTPPCLDLHRKLAAFRDAGATHAAIEVSSHALDQDRTAGMRFRAAVFTNLSRDHVDYHGSMRRYAESKARLFTEFESDCKVVNLDSEFGDELAKRCGSAAVVTSCHVRRSAGDRRYVFARSSQAVVGGSRVAVESSWGHGTVDIPLPGEFNISNALQVLAVLLGIGTEFRVACALIGELSAPPGRMQAATRPDENDVPAVFVDYAHTPAALEAALKALRPHVVGQLWCIFGCGGDRDVGKRPLMGGVVSRLADRVIVTNDNPRTESPAKIIGDVLEGVKGPGVAIEDRAAAIAYAIREAAATDVVLIAGKGHEDYQLIGDQRLNFSDLQTARANVDVRRAKEADND